MRIDGTRQRDGSAEEPIVGSLLAQSQDMPLHTDMQRVLRALAGREREFAWLVTDLECNRPPAALDPAQHAWLLSGDELRDAVLAPREPPQFVWGVFSGIPRGSEPDLDRLPVVPSADGNPHLWAPTPTLQLPGAVVEIVCWDATYTLLISSDADLTARFRAAFPDAEDLAAHCSNRFAPDE